MNLLDFSIASPMEVGYSYPVPEKPLILPTRRTTTRRPTTPKAPGYNYLVPENPLTLPRRGKIDDVPSPVSSKSSEESLNELNQIEDVFQEKLSFDFYERVRKGQIKFPLLSRFMFIKDQ